MKSQQPLISIITVCLNAERTIENTIKSVLNQTYKNVEYLVMDGASNDKTIKILDKYRDRINVISEKDSGIYNAMNRGIARAKGKYIYFINAGDTLCDEDVLEKVSYYLKDDNTIYYGIVNAISPGHIDKIIDFDETTDCTKDKLLKGLMPCHQAIFAPKRALSSHYFREDLKLRADFEWLCYSVWNGYSCERIELNIANYDLRGASGNIGNKRIMQRETKEIVKDYVKKGVVGDYTEQKESEWKELSDKHLRMVILLDRWLLLRQRNILLHTYFQDNKIFRIAIYGVGYIGERLIEELKCSFVLIDYVIETKKKNLKLDVPIKNLEGNLEHTDAIIVTAINDYENIKEVLSKKTDIKIISIEEIVQYCINQI